MVKESYSLDDIPFFASLTQTKRTEVARQCRWHRHVQGELIIDGQSNSRDIYFVITGTVRVVLFSLSGREISLADIGPGGYFGELAAIDGGPRSAFVMAQTSDTMTAALSHEIFLDLLSCHPLMGLEIIRRLATVVRQDTERIMELSTLGANNRVHAELLRQAKLTTRDGRTAMISPIPLHADIASRVSTTRETVARVLNELARANIVVRKKDGLWIRDIIGLTKLVDDVRGT